VIGDVKKPFAILQRMADFDNEAIMSALAIQFPLRAMTAGFRKFTVDEYERLISAGIITEDDNLELLEGYLVNKMGHNPPHAGTIAVVQAALLQLQIVGWNVRVQLPFRASTSEPEPDFAIVRGDHRSYLRRHPVSSDVGLAIEIADSTLDSDRSDKVRVYSRDAIGTYWIVNLVDSQVEVYTDPQPDSAPPTYATRRDFQPGQSLPLVLDGLTMAMIPVVDLLP